MDDLLDPMKNPLTYAIPFFLLFIAVELAALKWLDQDDDVTGYERRDATASLTMGVVSVLFTTLLKVGSFLVYVRDLRVPDALAPAHGHVVVLGRASCWPWTSPSTGSTASCTGREWAGRRTRRTTPAST